MSGGEPIGQSKARGLATSAPRQDDAERRGQRLGALIEDRIQPVRLDTLPRAEPKIVESRAEASLLRAVPRVDRGGRAAQGEEREGRSQGIALVGQQDQWRYWVGTHDGLGTLNTDFDSGAEFDFAVAGRVEFLAMGKDFSRFDQFSSWGGQETAGLPAEVLEDIAPERRVWLPMKPGNRSLNLSNSVAVMVFEAWRQGGFS